MTEKPARLPADTPYHRRLPIGARLDTSAISGDALPWAFESITMRPLQEMLVPEEPRRGEDDPSECPSCHPSEHTLWADEHWQVRGGWDASGLPFMAAISPVEHWLLEDAPIEVLAGLGPVMQRISEAVKQLPEVARCHFARWNDGSAHLHLWALARPAGMMQGRGAVLAFWDDLLPPIPAVELHANLDLVARALAAGGGRAWPNGSAHTPSTQG